MTDSSSTPPVFFNHLYVVLDDKTYRAIQASDFLRSAFPGVERRGTLTAAGETWYGTYFYCRDNYLEFFGASTGRHWQPGAQEGWAGVAFSTDQPGGVAQARQTIRDTFRYEPFNELRQLRTPEKTINWFYHVKLAEQLSLGSFDSWIMEYHPDIFEYKGITLSANDALTREAYLSAWNKNRWETTSANAAPALTILPAEGQTGPSTDNPVVPNPPGASQTNPTNTIRQKPRSHKIPRVAAPPAPPEAAFPRTPVFSRVIEATIHMDSKRAGRFAEILSLFGYAQEESRDLITLSANGFSLRIRPEAAAPSGFRLSSLRLEMARPSVAPMTFVFAPGSRLVLGEDMTAEWCFGL